MTTSHDDIVKQLCDHFDFPYSEDYHLLIWTAMREYNGYTDHCGEDYFKACPQSIKDALFALENHTENADLRHCGNCGIVAKYWNPITHYCGITPDHSFYTSWYCSHKCYSKSREREQRALNPIVNPLSEW